MSRVSEKGISILVSIPLVQGNSVIDNYSDKVNSYSHSISAVGGFTSCSFTTVGNQEFLEDWLQNGLGRHIKVFGPHQQVIWEGYVEELTINMGGASFSKGPLSSIGNRVVGMYTPLYEKCDDLPVVDPDCEDKNAPITGTETETYAADDLFSQSKYGIWEKIINLGELFTPDAEYIRDLYLYENAYPEGNPSLNIGNEGELSVTVTCKGYIEWLSYVYNYTTDETSHEISNIIKDILAEDPNNIISTSYERIMDNPTIAKQYTDENKQARGIIDELITYGGGDSDRWTLGVYKDRKVIYEPAPTDIEYLYYKTGRTQQVEKLSGEIVEPWDVLPCKWVAIPTFLASFGIKIEDVRNDPRVFFGEEVNFTAPDQVTISGAKIRKLSQYLASMGLGGV